MLSDDEIIKGCLKGKRAFHKLLYKKYAPVMFGVCQRYFSSRDQAEDVLQEGFIKVFTKLGDYRGEGSFEGWIRRIMVRSSLNHIRDNRKYNFHAEWDETQEPADESKLQPDLFTREDLLKTLQSLPEGYRVAFNLFEIEGYNHQEIADMLDCSISTSKTQLLKARRMLQKRLTDLYNENPMQE